MIEPLGNRAGPDREGRRLRVELKSWIPQEWILDPELLFRYLDALLELPTVESVRFGADHEIFSIERVAGLRRNRIDLEALPWTPDEVHRGVVADEFRRGVTVASSEATSWSAFPDRHVEDLPQWVGAFGPPSVECRVESRLKGDGHAAYAGSYRGLGAVEFALGPDGAIVDVQTLASHGRVDRDWSRRVRSKVENPLGADFSQRVDAWSQKGRSRTTRNDGITVDVDEETGAWAVDFEIGSPEAATSDPPQIDAQLRGNFSAPGTLSLEAEVARFPSFGVEVSEIADGEKHVLMREVLVGASDEPAGSVPEVVRALGVWTRMSARRCGAPVRRNFELELDDTSAGRTAAETTGPPQRADAPVSTAFASDDAVELDAEVAPSKSVVRPGATVTFDASGSHAPEGTRIEYEWTGVDGTGERVEHCFEEAGYYDVRVTLRDESGRTADASTAVTVLPEGSIVPAGPWNIS